MSVENIAYIDGYTLRDAQGSQAGAVVDADHKSIRVVASTDAPVGGVDPEDGDVIPQEEWSFDRWNRAGAPILDGHYMGPGACGGSPADVVGNGSQIETDKADGLTRTLVTITWDRKLPRGADLARQYGEGIRSAVSVGFVPRSRVKRTALAEGDVYRVDPTWSRESGRPGGSLLRRPTLLELSAVTVGADPHALAQRGLDVGGVLTFGDQVDAMMSRIFADPAAVERMGPVIGRALHHEGLRALLVRALVDDVRAELARTADTIQAEPEVDPWIRALAEWAPCTR